MTITEPPPGPGHFSHNQNTNKVPKIRKDPEPAKIEPKQKVKQLNFN